MEIIANNVNDAFLQGLNLIQQWGVRQDSRNGPVLVTPFPVITAYANPRERVLFHGKRDANPVFHLMESLWMLAGRNDARWLDQFVSDFSSRFAEDDGIQHGAYGFRWRHHFDVDGGGRPGLPDQLDTVVKVLKASPDSRQAVLTMWDPVSDLDVKKRDVPCNTHVYLRMRQRQALTIALDMTVCCRSNDIIWGAYGANAVHFSVLQEYLAARIGVDVGIYYQISNNFHAYEAALARFDRADKEQVPDPYTLGAADVTPIVTDPEHFDEDLKWFFEDRDWTLYHNSFFSIVAAPLARAYAAWRAKDYPKALDLVQRLPEGSDWRVATEFWMTRRLVKMGKISMETV